MTTVTYEVGALENVVGTEFGPGPWLLVDQERIDTFAEATGDHQWIHVDPKRAKQGPFGATVAHGYLTLSLVAPLLEGLVRVEGATMAVNYGLDRVRFPAPVVSGSRLRARAVLASVEPAGAGSVQAAFQVTIELDGGGKPVCVATALCRYYRQSEEHRDDNT